MAAVLVLGLEVPGLGLHHLLAPVLLEAGPRSWYWHWWRVAGHSQAGVFLEQSLLLQNRQKAGILVLVSSLLTGYPGQLLLGKDFLTQVLEVAM